MTRHELAALRLLARGLHHTEIVTALGVRPQMAGWLLYRAWDALQARTLAHAVALACQMDLFGDVPG